MNIDRVYWPCDSMMLVSHAPSKADPQAAAAVPFNSGTKAAAANALFSFMLPPI